MTRSWKFSVVVTIMMLAGLALLPSYVAVSAQEPFEASQIVRSVTVSGDGQVEGKPHVAVVTLGVQSEAETADKALARNSADVQALIATLRKAGVEAADIQIQTLPLEPRYEQPGLKRSQPSMPTLTEYVATSLVEVRVRDLDAMGELLDAAVRAGADQIQGIRFQISDLPPLSSQVQTAA
jgi:uncharacterized protein